MTTNATAGPRAVIARAGRAPRTYLLELIVNQTDPTAETVEERVARHLAARDWLTDEDRWVNATAAFRADYLTAAREVIALVQPSAVVSPRTDRAAEDRVRALHRKATHGDDCVHCAAFGPAYDNTWPCQTIRALDGTLPDAVLRRLAVEAHDTGTQQPCPTSCDPDCDAHCHEAHQPAWKRDHQPATHGADEPAPVAQQPAALVRSGDATVDPAMCPRCKGDNSEAFELCTACAQAEQQAAAADGEETHVVSCSAVVLKRRHGTHRWEPQPGMTGVRCPGYSD